MFRTDRIQENLEALSKAGIRNPKAANLARLRWVTKEYIEAHVRQAVEVEGQRIGLAIWRMENKKDVKNEHNDSQKT